jgi:hypothetical protein
MEESSNISNVNVKEGWLAQLKSDYTLVSQLQNKDSTSLSSSSWLSTSSNSNACIVSGIVTLILTVFSTFLFGILVTCVSSDHSREGFKNSATLSYRMTNLCTNLVLGIYGLYYHLTILPTTTDIVEQIQGYTSLTIFGCLQMGYNLWSIPMGIWVVKEPMAMQIHHVAAMVTAALSTFGRNGFRYYTPYFFGCIEISSVPLAMMNYFKDNSHLIKQHPTFYTTIRLNFVVLFLSTRVLFWTPLIYSVLRSSLLLWATSPTLSSSFAIGTFTLMVTTLTLLQYFWATKIVSALFKMFQPPKPKHQ